MKLIYVVSLLFFTQIVFAQKTASFYDYRWQPCDAIKARFYSTLEKTDSGWMRMDYFLATMKLQMSALYEDSACKIENGGSVHVYANGQIESIGRYLHKKREGVCLSFYPNGMMSDSANYHNDRAIGFKYRWWPNGIIADSVSHVNDSTDVEMSWFDNGQVSQAGYLINTKPHGKWKYFHLNGQIAATEVYDHGKLINKEYFNEDGSVQPDTSNTKANKDAMFKKGLSDWQKYLSNKLYWPNGLAFNNGDMAVVLVQIDINEAGKVEDAWVVTPFHPAFDKIAVDAIKNSPPWSPRLSHNRRVKASFRQPVTFMQP